MNGADGNTQYISLWLSKSSFSLLDRRLNDIGSLFNDRLKALQSGVIA